MAEAVTGLLPMLYKNFVPDVPHLTNLTKILSLVYTKMLLFLSIFHR